MSPRAAVELEVRGASRIKWGDEAEELFEHVRWAIEGLPALTELTMVPEDRRTEIVFQPVTPVLESRLKLIRTTPEGVRFVVESLEWLHLPWFDLHSGTEFRITTTDDFGASGRVLVKTYRDVLAAYEMHPEAKSRGVA